MCVNLGPGPSSLMPSEPASQRPWQPGQEEGPGSNWQLFINSLRMVSDCLLPSFSLLPQTFMSLPSESLRISFTFFRPLSCPGVMARRFNAGYPSERFREASTVLEVNSVLAGSWGRSGSAGGESAARQLRPDQALFRYLTTTCPSQLVGAARHFLPGWRLSGWGCPSTPPTSLLSHTLE